MAIFGKKKDKTAVQEGSPTLDGTQGSSNATAGSNGPQGSQSVRGQGSKTSPAGPGNLMSPQDFQQTQQASQFGALANSAPLQRGPQPPSGPNGPQQGSAPGQQSMSTPGALPRQAAPGQTNPAYGSLNGPTGVSGLPSTSGSGMPFQGGPGVAPTMASGPSSGGGPDRARPQQQVVYPWSQRSLVMNPPRFIDETRQPQPGALSPSPFPRYGHAVNSVASSNGEVYLFGGLVRESVKNDLYVVSLDRIVQNPTQTPPMGSNGAPGSQPSSAGAILATLVQTTGEIPPPRVGHATVLVANVLILWGGDTKVRADDRQDEGLYLLNLSTREWTRVRPGIEGPNSGPVGRYGHTVSIVGSRFYVFGGQVDGTFMNDMWSFDLNSLKTTPKWEALKTESELPPKRTGHASVTLKDKIYIFGGTDGQYHYNDTWCYDVPTNTWKELSCIGYIPVPREGHAACLVDDIMYIFGGRGVDGKDLGDLASFRISNQRWYMFANMGPSPTGRSGHALTSFQNKVVVLGGESFTGTKSDDPSISYVLDTAKIKYPPEGTPKLSAAAGSALPSGRKSEQPTGRAMSPSERAISPSHREQPTSFGSAIQQHTPGSTQASPARNASMQNMAAAVGSPTAGPRSGSAAAAYAGPRSQRSFEELRTGPATGAMSPRAQGRGINGLDRQRTMSPVAQDGFHYGGMPVNGMRGTTSMGSSSAELDSMRRRETWMKAALALAVKKGFVMPEEINDVDGTKISRDAISNDGLNMEEIDTGAPGSEKERIMQTLLSLKSQLAQAKSTIAQQARSEADRIGESDRARVAALNEAAFHRAKLDAYETGNVREADRLQRDRSNDMERQISESLRETTELERQIARLREELKLEQQLRASAEDRLNEASKRAMAAEAAQLKMHEELAQLQSRSRVQESDLRDHRERVATLSSLVAKHRSEGEHMRGKLDEQQTLSDHHVATLRELQQALGSTTSRADEHERLHYQHRDLVQDHQMTIAQLRSELGTKKDEADAHASRAAELENMLAQHRSEIDTHRAATTGGLAALLAHHDQKSSSRGVDDDAVPSHVTDRLNTLEDEIDAHRENANESKMSADRAHKLVEEMRESNQRLERQQSGMRSEMDAMRSQLAIALQEVARLKDTSSRKEVELRDTRRQFESSQVKHGMLRQFMTQRGIAMPDEGETAQNGSVADERLQSLEAENEAQTRKLDETEQRLRQSLAQIEQLTHDLEQTKTTASRSLATADHAATQRATLAERELQETHATYRDRTAQLENDYQTAVQFVKGSEKMLRRMKDELTKYKTENSSLQNELMHARSGAYTPDNAAAKDIEALRTRLTELTRQHDEVTSENRTLEQRMASTIAAQKDFRDQNRDALAAPSSSTNQMRTQELELHVHSLEENLDALRQQLQETQALNAHLSNELRATTPSAAAASASAPSTKLAQDLSSAQKQNEQLRFDRDTLAHRLQDTEDKLQLLLGRVGTNDSDVHSGGMQHDESQLLYDEGRDSQGMSITSELDKWERDRAGESDSQFQGLPPLTTTSLSHPSLD